MTSKRPSLGVVLTDLGPHARLLVGHKDALDVPITGASIWAGGVPSPDPAVVLVPVVGERADGLEALLTALEEAEDSPRILILSSACAAPRASLARLAPHTVIEAASVDAADIVLAVSRAAEAPEENITRRLAALQRSLTQALAAPDPVPDLLVRLRSSTNGHVALVDKHGQCLHSTGPIPLTTLFEQVSRTDADSQMLDIDGWKGVADRVRDPDTSGDYIGWLIAASRHPDFPDQYSAAAVHVAASLVEASHRMTFVARQQERAIKAAVLEEALALRRIPEDPELVGRVASFGLNLKDGVRIAIVKPLRTARSERGLPDLDGMAEELAQSLRNAAIPHLMSRRERQLVMAVQCSAATLNRLVVASPSIPKAHVGVGRSVTTVGEIADSHSDASLALRTLHRAGHGARLLAYEDFDFAMRLFSEVGVDRMTQWAKSFLQPLVERPTLLQGLSAYFKHSQNMNAAADALSIHHNSLRYRLAKIEDLLKVSLRDPAGLASLFLALTALEHDAGTARDPRIGSKPERPADVDAPFELQPFAGAPLDRLGVVLNPDRR